MINVIYNPPTLDNTKEPTLHRDIRKQAEKKPNLLTSFMLNIVLDGRNIFQVSVSNPPSNIFFNQVSQLFMVISVNSCAQSALKMRCSTILTLDSFLFDVPVH